MVRSGFWNSLGSDVRTYYNTDFSHLMSLLITDGIYQNYGSQFATRPGSGMQVIVAPGESWFNEIWLRNDTDLQIDFNAAPVVAGYKRIDAIAIKIDSSNAVREATIAYVAGTASSNPSAPTLTDTDEVKWHLLFHVTVPANTTSITAGNIKSYIGTSTCPFITGILKTVDITNLVAQWSAQFTEYIESREQQFDAWAAQQQSNYEAWIGEQETTYELWYNNMVDAVTTEVDTFESTNEAAFATWFEHIAGQLSEDAATHLQEQIDAICFFYVDNTTLYLPNTAASVSGDTITIGTTTQEEEG